MTDIRADVICGAISIDERISNATEELQKTNDRIEQEFTHINKELQDKVSELTTRLEDIQKLNERLDEVRVRRHAIEMRAVKNHRRVAEKMYRRSMIINIILCIVLVGFVFMFFKMNNKYLETINNYNELTSNYIDMIEKYEALEKDVSSLEDKFVNATIKSNAELNFIDISKPSNLTADQLNTIISIQLDSINAPHGKISGIGEELVKMEEEYSVNALFCLSVGSLESGHGTSIAANKKNNLFGLIGNNGIMTFDSVESCISYWGNLIRNHYIDKGLTTISAIQNKYCPDSSTWSNNVNYFMNTYANHVNSYFIKKI